MSKRLRQLASLGGSNELARADEGNLPRAQQLFKADDLVIRIDRPLPPPMFVSDATCESILGIDRAVFRRVAKRLPHRREHGVIVVERDVIVAELRSVSPAPKVEKPKPIEKKTATAAELLARAGFRRAG